MIKNDWDKKLRRAATGSKEQVSQLGQDLIDMNYDDWTEGESYESLVKRYQGKGQKAMDDTIGQVAARTGGLASSYAAQAGQQAYGGWMENIENAARSLYDTERQELMDRYNIANDIYQQGVNEQRYMEEKIYQRSRDAIADQWRATEWEYKISKDKKEENEKAIEDLKNEMHIAAYYGNGSWPQFKERATALGLTKDDYEQIVHNANRAYDTDAYGLGNTKASIDATEELETRIKNGEDISTLTDLITLSGKPASWWAAYQSYEFSNKAEADAAEAAADAAEAAADAAAAASAEAEAEEEKYETNAAYFKNYVDRLIKADGATDATIAEGIAKYITQYYGEDIKEEYIPEVEALLEVARRMGVDVDNIW